jgi:Mrp family chromosome partitioning ATPase
MPNLSRTYRPKTFADITDQTSVKQTLRLEVQTNKVSHAYLLGGPRGVGKTTTAVNLGAYLARSGKRVLLVDLDPQANATSGLGIDHKKLERGIYEVLVTPTTMRDVITPTQIDDYHVAPATLALAGASVELVLSSAVSR